MRRESPSVRVEYSRAVRPEGNPKALSVMDRVFERTGARWRGLFEVPDSGLRLRREYGQYDAGAWEVELPRPAGDRGCRCGEVLCGKIKPVQCPLFAKNCSLEDPVGPCMVSSEGTCASYYLYDRGEDALA
jgi:hydrogenase expression/formation protein HypD